MRRGPYCPLCGGSHHTCGMCGHPVPYTPPDPDRPGECPQCGCFTDWLCHEHARPDTGQPHSVTSPWTPGQQRNVQRLMAQFPERPWWVAVCPPQRPAACPCSPTLIMACHHTSWRSMLPPCGPECVCTVRALTPAEARRAHAEFGRRK